MLTAAPLRVHTRASHPSCSRDGSAGTSNHSSYLDDQRQWNRRISLWAVARAPPHPLLNPSSEGPRAEGPRGGPSGGPEQAGGHGRASVEVGGRMVNGQQQARSCDPAGARPRHRRQVNSPKPREQQPRAWAGFGYDWVWSITGTSCNGCGTGKRALRQPYYGTGARLVPCAWRARARQR